MSIMAMAITAISINMVNTTRIITVTIMQTVINRTRMALMIHSMPTTRIMSHITTTIIILKHKAPRRKHKGKTNHGQCNTSARRANT